MNTDALLKRAADIARKAHAGQQYGDQPYIVHVLAVAERVAQRSVDPLNLIVAYLHDVVEDSQITGEELTKEFGAEIGEAVDALTRRQSDVNYTQYIMRLAPNPRARLVKLCDLTVNSENILQNGRKRKNLLKYQLALSYLYHIEAKQTEVSTKQVTLKKAGNGLNIYDSGTLREVTRPILATVWNSCQTDAAGVMAVACFLAPLTIQAFINTHPSYVLDDLTLTVFGLPAVHLLQFLQLPSKEAAL